MKEVKTGLVLEAVHERNVYGRYSGCFDGRKNPGGRRDWSFGGSCIWL